MKNSKGITLIALIITIVVLITLSGVAIATVQESNIIKKAQEATKTYKEKEEEEKAILEGYMSMLEGNLPDAEPETASIVGIYGNTTASELTYFVLEEDGTGRCVYNNNNNSLNEKKFTYIVNGDGTGTVTWEDNKVEEFGYEFIKDSNGKIVNTLLGIEKITVPAGTALNDKEIIFYDDVVTKNGKNGFDKANGTYEYYKDSSMGIVITDDSFTIKNQDGTQDTQELGDYELFKHNNIIYAGIKGVYTAGYIIFDNNKIAPLGS